MARRNLATIDRNTWSPMGRLIQEANAHGIENDLIHGGLMAGQTAVQGLYVVQTTKNCVIGTRRVTWDGRVFRYCYAGAACNTHIGNVFFNAIPATGIDYSLLAAVAPAGSTSVVMTNQGTVAIATDALVGGQIVLKELNASDDTAVEIRRVTSNTADASVGHDGLVTISFAEPTTVDLTLLSYAYVMPAPWSDIRYSAVLTQAAHIGYAAAYCNAAGLYHWEQTWGITQGSPQGECGKTAYGRGLVWRYDGSLQYIDSASPIGGSMGQFAGYTLDNNAASNGQTMWMMQCDH